MAKRKEGGPKRKVSGARLRGKWYHLDVMIDGERYREPLRTSDWREASTLAQNRIAEIKAGKVASPAGKAFARLPFKQAAEVYVSERKGKRAERTVQFETERLRPLTRYFGDKPLKSIKPEDIAAYQKKRIADIADPVSGRTVSGRTINMETGILHQMMEKAKLFNVLMDFPERYPENVSEIGKALPVDQKLHLFRVAASKPRWFVAHCAAVLSVNTTGRKIEVRTLRWKDVDLFVREWSIKRSKTHAGYREIPLNSDALAALAKLRERAEDHGPVEPEHYVFPACENNHLDPTKPQTSWRSAWRSLRKEAGRQAGRLAAIEALNLTHRINAAKAAWRAAAAPYAKLRFHDLRHQAITEAAENGAADAALMALAGHMSKRMLEHYSHIRKAAKREITDKLACDLMNPAPMSEKTESTRVN